MVGNNVYFIIFYLKTIQKRYFVGMVQDVFVDNVPQAVESSLTMVVV